MEVAPEVLISSQALLHNLRRLQHISNFKAVFPVIKAEAYGHNASLVAQLLQEVCSEEEVPMFCVARIPEAVDLRNVGIQRRILILSHFSRDEISHIQGAPVELAIHHGADIEEILSWEPSLQKKVSGLHLNLNTGMNRLGFRAQNLSQEGPALLTLLDKVSEVQIPWTGIMSHFARSEEENISLNAEQESLFVNFVEYIKKNWKGTWGPFPQWIHMANSAGICRGLANSELFTAVRPGIHLWGAYHSSLEKKKNTFQFRPVLEVRAPLRQVFWLSSGEALGYGQRYRCSRPTLVGSIGFGYADGLKRMLSRFNGEVPKIYFNIEEEDAPILGTISMDLCMVDLTDHSLSSEFMGLQEQGKLPWAYWISQKQTVEDIAEACHSISYEIFCSLGHRLKRRKDKG